MYATLYYVAVMLAVRRYCLDVYLNRESGT